MPVQFATSGLGHANHQCLLQGQLQRAAQQTLLRKPAHCAAALASRQAGNSLQHVRRKSLQMVVQCGSWHEKGWTLRQVASGALPPAPRCFGAMAHYLT
jgi:hypothetical protein